MFPLLLLLFSLCQVTNAYTGILALHFHSFGIDLTKIDCMHPFENRFNRVGKIRSGDDCQIYIRACVLGITRSTCLQTESYSFMHNYTGGLAFSLEDKTKKSKVKLQFRSPDILLDTYLVQNHEFIIEEVRNGNVMNNNTLKSPQLRGSVLGLINCGEGFELDFTKYFCEIDPHPLPYVEVQRVIETSNGSIVTTMFIEKETFNQVPVEHPPSPSSPPPLTLVPPIIMQPKENLIHCKKRECGDEIIFIILGFSLFLFILSITVCCFVVSKRREAERRNVLVIQLVDYTNQPPPFHPFDPEHRDRQSETVPCEQRV